MVRLVGIRSFAVVTIIFITSLRSITSQIINSVHNVTFVNSGKSTDYSAVLITSLFNIGRESNDGRKIDSYIEWLTKTLMLRHPMVVFVDSSETKIAEAALRVRKSIVKLYDIPSIIVSTSLDLVPYYNISAKVGKILMSKNWKSKAKYPNDITNKNPLYVVIQYSKFEWMSKASQLIENRWSYSAIGWVDAGISRFFPAFKKSDTTIAIQDQIIRKCVDSNSFCFPGAERLPQLFENPRLISKDSYIGTNECIVKGGIFISARNRLEDVRKAIQEFVYNELLAKDRVDNEQIALACLVSEHPTWFAEIVLNNDRSKAYDDKIFSLSHKRI